MTDADEALAALKHSGHVTATDLARLLQWNPTRAHAALGTLIQGRDVSMTRESFPSSFTGYRIVYRFGGWHSIETMPIGRTVAVMTQTGKERLARRPSYVTVKTRKRRQPSLHCWSVGPGPRGDVSAVAWREPA